MTRGEPVEFRHLSGSRRKRFYSSAEAALALPEAEWPIRPLRVRVRPTPEEEQRFRALKSERDRVAADLRLDPSLIAPKAALEAVAANREEGARKLLRWQRELLQLNDV